MGRTGENLPNGRADVVVKVILDESTHDAGLPHASVLEEDENRAMKTQYKQNPAQGSLLPAGGKWDIFFYFIPEILTMKLYYLHKRSMLKVSFRNVPSIHTN